MTDLVAQSRRMVCTNAVRGWLAREVTDLDLAPPRREVPPPTLTRESVFALAKKHGTYDKLQKATKLAETLGLGIRPYKTSLMFTPPTNGTRVLFTLWAIPEKGGPKAYVGVEPFTEFFPLNRRTVLRSIGPEGWRTLTNAEFERLLRGLKSLRLDSLQVDK